MAHDPQGFLRHARVETPKRPIEQRIRDWQPIYLTPRPETVAEQASRCMDCGVPFCHHGCPLGNLIPEWNELAARDDLAAATDRLHATNNFPEFTGWICPAPCEAACVLAINADPVTIKQVELAIIDRAFAGGRVTPQPPAEVSGAAVAIVGSGPAGLAAAQQLCRAGHAVTVYERDDRAGGLLRYGIPDFKLPKHLVDRRLAQLQDEGVTFVLNADVGPDQVDDLRARYDAVVLAVGALAPRDLPVPGRQLRGVHQAMPYLRAGNRAQTGTAADADLDARDRHVVIVGGGDTAADCLGTANRQGARSVTVLDHNPRPTPRNDLINPVWPHAPSTRGRSPAHDEGVHEAWSQEAHEFRGDTGVVQSVRTEQVEIIRHAGRREFRNVPNSGIDLPADLVLLATGFVGTDSGPLLDGLGVARDPERGTARVDSTWATDSPGVFACGDATRGASLVVWAIADGRSCAAAVDTWLADRPAYRQPL